MENLEADLHVVQVVDSPAPSLGDMGFRSNILPIICEFVYVAILISTQSEKLTRDQ